MQNNQNTNIEHIIAKIDNDFNIDTTDYIPRIAAWVIEALSILKCSKKEYKTRELKVNNKIAISECPLDIKGMKVYDKNGCIIENMESSLCGCNVPSTGNFNQSGRGEQIAIPLDPKNVAGDYVTMDRYKIQQSKYYIALCDRKLELNFDTDKIYIKSKEVKTYYSEKFGVELPVIPNNGLLIEAVGYYCLYKILCRGIKHPVFNLSASQYGTNPFFIWNSLKDQAKRSVLFDKQGNVIEDGGQWRNSFFNFTFNPEG